MPQELSPQELDDVKRQCQNKLAELGPDGFVDWVADQLIQAASRIVEQEERLRLGLGANF